MSVAFQIQHGGPLFWEETSWEKAGDRTLETTYETIPLSRQTLFEAVAFLGKVHHLIYFAILIGMLGPAVTVTAGIGLMIAALTKAPDGDMTTQSCQKRED